MAFSHPENHSKDRLKAELKKKGIAFSPNKPKDYYVQLYRDNVLPTTRHRSELSSDEETISQKIVHYTIIYDKLPSL